MKELRLKKDAEAKYITMVCKPADKVHNRAKDMSKNEAAAVEK